MRRKKYYSIIIMLFIICLISLVVFQAYENDSSKNIAKDEDSLTNIDECSEEFMSEYLEQYANTQEADKKNILIVISKEGIKNDYGATKIINAPNNQYMLQYASSEDKDNALEQFKRDNSILSVEENEKVTFFDTEDTSYNSWGIEKMALDGAIRVTNERNNLPDVRVAVIDTGCDVKLVNKYYPGKISETYDVLKNTDLSMSDSFGHGTHIAGTIAEGTPSNVKIIPVKVSEGEEQYYSDIISAIDYITYYEKADVIEYELWRKI